VEPEDRMANVTARLGGRTVVAAMAAILAVGAAGPAKAGGFSTPDFGTRRCGMMAVMGKPDDLTAIFANPAGLTLQKGTNVYLTAQATFVDLGFKFYDSKGKLRGTIKDNAELKPDQSWGVLPFLAIGSDFGTKKLRGGLAIYAPNFFGAVLPKNEPTRYHLVSGFFAAVHMTGALAYEITEKFSLGAGISAVYLRQQGVQYMNDQITANPDLRWDDSEAVRAGDRKMDLMGAGWTWNWNVGLLFRPIKTLGLGFSFISGADVTLKGPLKITNSLGATQKLQQTTNFTLPFTLRAGINWEFIKDVEIGVDMFYWHYQTLQEQVMKAGVIEMRTPKNYNNAWNISAGMMYRPIPELDLMVGYQHDATPIPTSTLSLDNITRSHNGISMGARWRALKWLQVGLTYQRTWYELMNIQDSVLSPPVNGKGHGSMHHVALDLAFKVL
jgi:long-chain fatty acid transport protein